VRTLPAPRKIRRVPRPSTCNTIARDAVAALTGTSASAPAADRVNNEAARGSAQADDLSTRPSHGALDYSVLVDHFACGDASIVERMAVAEVYGE
jgi:hypothetical protein